MRKQSGQTPIDSKLLGHSTANPPKNENLRVRLACPRWKPHRDICWFLEVPNGKYPYDSWDLAATFHLIRVTTYPVRL